MKWELYKQRLRAALETLHEGDPVIDPQRARMLMEQRARALARPVYSDDQPGNKESQKWIEVVSFCLGEHRYAIDAAYVHGIDRPTSMTVLPGAPALFVGVTNIRGSIIAVVELAIVLGVTREAAPAERMLVLGSETIELAVLVDAVDEIRTISWRDIRPLTDTGLMRAITDGGVVLLDAASLLADPRLVLE